MAPPKGFRHTAESIASMTASRTGKAKSAEHKAKISVANKGKVRARIHARTCACGKDFLAGVPNAIFCSVRCMRAAKGHGLRHAPQFAHFPKLCAICLTTDELVGDHDHASGAPRGILCRNCNLAIGNMVDSPERLRAAADYLENC